MARLLYNNQVGNLAADPGISGTNITFLETPDFATITGTDYIPIALDPGRPTFEIVYLTAYTAGDSIGTVTRAAEDATKWPAVAHPNGTWMVAPTAYDLTTELSSTYVPLSSVFTASTIRATTGAPSVLAQDQTGDFAFDTTDFTMYGPFNGTSWATSPVAIIGTRTIVPMGAPGSVFFSANWYPQVAAAGTAAVMTVDTGYAIPFVVGTTQSFTDIGANVTVGGGTGSVIRFGIYSDNGSGYPYQLIVDGGTEATTGTGAKSVTLGTPQSLTPALYWLVAVAQVGTQPTVTTIQNGGSATPFAIFGSAAAGSVNGSSGYSKSALTSGAGLPGTFTAGAGAIVSPPVISVKAQ